MSTLEYFAWIVFRPELISQSCRLSLGTKGFAKAYGFDEADLLADTNARLRKIG